SSASLPHEYLYIPDLIRLAFTLLALWLWGLALWFFLVSIIGNLRLLISHKLHFSLGWWSFVFPNTAFVLATLSVGTAVDSKPLRIFGTVVTAVVVAMWCLAAGG